MRTGSNFANNDCGPQIKDSRWWGRHLSFTPLANSHQRWYERVKNKQVFALPGVDKYNPTPFRYISSLCNRLPRSILFFLVFQMTAFLSVRSSLVDKTRVFCNMTPCRMINIHRRFYKAQCLHLQSQAALNSGSSSPGSVLDCWTLTTKSLCFSENSINICQSAWRDILWVCINSAVRRSNMT